MAPIQKDATGTHIAAVCAQVVLVLTVATIVLLIVGIVLHGKKSARENVGMVHKKRGTGMNGLFPDVGLHYE